MKFSQHGTGFAPGGDLLEPVSSLVPNREKRRNDGGVAEGEEREMASLNKLAIRGIRSFDDKHVQVIEFYSPLTVIVGHNGSGKTTIIECLKYSTTGQMPPNAKTGGAFIHDPKMANEKEVKAQVRLRFWNVNRQRMTVTRNLSVTIGKKGNLTQKTLEGLLAKASPEGDDGKRNTISTKCAEMDEEVPLLLGVSQSILDNVIFCHQEESNWPMSEPSVLKKKFDDIFEATKYTKALDNIKALRKERTAELKVDKERLKFLKTDKDRAEKMRKQLADDINKENKKHLEAERFREEFENLRQINARHYNEATGFNTIFERFERLKGEKAMHEKNRKGILEGMSEMSEPSEELTHKLRNFDTHLKTTEGKKAKQSELREKEDAALDDLRRRERILASRQGGFLANKEAHQRNLKEREIAVREAAKTHNFAGYDYSPLEEGKVLEFVDKVHELVRRAESDLKRLQADGARTERDLQAELDRLASSKTSALATKKSKQDQISKLHDKIRSSESAFDSITSVDVEIEMLESKIAEAEEAQGRVEQEIRDARYDEQLRDKTLVIRQKEAERDKINAELSALNRQADSRAQLSIKRGELQSRSSQVTASVASHSARFKDLVGTDLEAETMEEKIILAAGRKDREVQEAESSASAVNRGLSQLQTTLNIAKRSLKEKTDDHARLEKQITDGMKESSAATVEDAITEAEEELKMVRAEMNSKTSFKPVWESFISNAKNKKKCTGCNRAIAHNEETAVLSYMQNALAKASRIETKELQVDEKNWIDELERLRSLLASQATMNDLEHNVIPPLEKQVAEEGGRLDKVQEEVEEAKLKVQRAKLAARDLQTLKGAAALVTRSLGEIKDLKSDILRLERDLQSTGSLKTVEDVQDEVEHISNEIKNSQREQANLVNEKEVRTNSVRGYGDDINKKTLRLGHLKGQQDRHLREQAALRDLQENLTQLQSEMKDLDAAASTAEAPWREKNEDLNRYRNERQNAENDASLQAGIYQSTVNDVESRHRACQTYVTEGNDRKIRETDVQIDDLKREISASHESRGVIDANIAALQDELSRSNSLKNNISANLRFREAMKDIQKVQSELEEIDIEQAAKSRKEFNSRYKDKLEDENKAQTEWHVASGQLSSMIENRKKLEETLHSEYSNTEKQFKEQLIKTKVGEFANNDLEKYGKALDNAILRYHSIKMDEINDTIGHLWNKTYQGTDIDGVRIVSDHDEEPSSTTRKSYNYRVVMVKNDVELDMRGRCSAGQKVLASIIIRLALAESFGQGCGVLALDEPTTNLDQENINALAEALAEIIRERRRQANFQLIVITHDEGFLQRLAAHDVLEYYWRVSRDASQKSILERQRVGL